MQVQEHTRVVLTALDRSLDEGNCDVILKASTMDG